MWCQSFYLIKIDEVVRMFEKYGMSTLREFSEVMYRQYGVRVAILAGYCDAEGESAVMLYVSNFILFILLFSYALTCFCSYDNNHKLGGTSFKDRNEQWPKDPLVEDFSKWTAESFGLSALHFKIYILTKHTPRDTAW
jgi:hypothetical protein